MKFSSSALVAITALSSITSSTVEAFAFVGKTAFVPKSTTALSYRLDPEQDLFHQELMEQEFQFPHGVVGPPPPPPPFFAVEEMEAEAAAAAAAADFQSPPQQNQDTSMPLKSRDVESKRMALANAGMAAPDVFATSAPKKIQGRGALKTWTVREMTDRVQVLLKSKNEGMPLQAEIEMWNGPENTPLKLNMVSEDGNAHPFSLVLNTPDVQNAVAIKNTGLMEFPLQGVVIGDSPDQEAGQIVSQLEELGEACELNGESVESFAFPPQVEAVQVLLRTDGRPLHARVELTQGPGHVKQFVDVFSENGCDQPLFCVIDTPGIHGATIRVVNTGTVVFPLTAHVEPYMVTDSYVPPAEGASTSNHCKNTNLDVSDNTFIV